jgi:flagellar FliL protein
MALTTSKTKTTTAPRGGRGHRREGTGKKKKLLIALPLLVVMVAGLVLPARPRQRWRSREAAKPEPGEVLQLQPITMNLADGRLLKIGWLCSCRSRGRRARRVSGSVALDEAIAYLGEQTYDQLAAPGARQAAKKELSQRITKRYDKAVMEVYFTEFVMQ